MKDKFLYFFKYCLLFYFLLLTNLNAANVNVSSDNEIESDDTSNKYIFDAADQTLTIKSDVTAGASSANQNIQIDEQDNATIVIESGATLQGTNTLIKGNDADGLTVTNSGTISASTNRAINLLDATNATITNNSGAIISAATGNTINGAINDGSVSGNTITNSGTIYATSGVAVRFYNNSTSTTITNNSGGVIYNNSNNETIRLGGSSTLTNAGKIENKNDPSNDAIDIEGNSSTITLKDGGILIGKIRSAGTSNTLKIQHGVGQSYFYETAGNDMTLQDLDGNQVVKGSAGSVGQGGNENIDELLGYKSLNIRKSLDKFVKSEGFKNKETEWQGIQATSLERKEHTKNLALGYEFYSLGVNIIRPSENENVIASFEYSEQDFQKDHTIKRYNLLFGLHYNESENKFKDNSFILAGATLNEGERKILTNTTSSGTLNINDTYESFEIHAGKRFKNKSLIPNLGTNLSYSYTPDHSESKYYSWDDKHVANFSLDLSDEFSIEREKSKSKFGIGWVLDYRTLITGSKTDYSVNGTKATYKQDDDLTKEMTLSVSINYEKKFYKFGKILISIDGMQTTQDVSSIGANISFIKIL
jgi:hypothetical protein